MDNSSNIWNNDTTLNDNSDAPLSNSNILIICIYLIIFVLGSSGNVLVIRYFAFQCKSKHPYNIYLIHLAIADLISAIITPLHFVYGVLSSNKWYFGSVPCTLVSVIGPLTVNVSSWILASIAFERYRGIVSPLKPRWTKMKIHVTVVCIWLVSLVTLIPYMLSIEVIQDACIPHWKHVSYELSSAVVTLVLQSILPICFMFFTISRILRTLKNRLKVPSSMSSTSSSSNTNTTTSSNTTRKTTPKHRNSQISRSSHQEDVCHNQKRDNSIRFKIPNDNSSFSSYSHSKRNSTTSKLHRYSISSSVYSVTSRTSARRPEKEIILPSTTNLSVRSCEKHNRSFSEPNLKDIMPILKFKSNLTINRPTVTSSQEGTSSVDGSAVQIQMNVPEISFYTRGSIRQRKHGRIENNKVILENTTSSNFSQVKLNRKKSISMCALNTYCVSKPDASSVNNTPIRPRKKISSTYRKFRNMLTLQNKREKSRNRKQRQTIRMLIATFTAFVVCSLPYNIFYVTAIVLLDFLSRFEFLQPLTDLHLWLSTLVVANSIMNCYIYAGMNTGFRQYARNLFSSKQSNNRGTLRTKSSIKRDNNNLSRRQNVRSSWRLNKQVSRCSEGVPDSEQMELQTPLVRSNVVKDLV